jgi:hypothetical protein
LIKRRKDTTLLWSRYGQQYKFYGQKSQSRFWYFCPCFATIFKCNNLKIFALSNSGILPLTVFYNGRMPSLLYEQRTDETFWALGGGGAGRRRAHGVVRGKEKHRYEPILSFP